VPVRHGRARAAPAPPKKFKILARPVKKFSQCGPGDSGLASIVTADAVTQQKIAARCLEVILSDRLLFARCSRAPHDFSRCYYDSNNFLTCFLLIPVELHRGMRYCLDFFGATRNNKLLAVVQDPITKTTVYFGLDSVTNQYSRCDERGQTIAGSPYMSSGKALYDHYWTRGPRGASVGTLMFLYNGIPVAEILSKIIICHDFLVIRV
jgi:hypothetical protein